MTFGEKVRAGRLALGYAQKDVAEKAGLSVRTVQHYESGKMRPKQDNTYLLLARVLDIPADTLRDDGADLELAGKDKRGQEASAEARRLAEEVSVLYAGGQLCEEDMDAMMRAIQDAYRIAKEGRKRGGTGEAGGNA